MNKNIKLLRLGYTEFNLVFANFLEKYVSNNSRLDQHISSIRSVYVDWIYKTAGYYDKEVEIKNSYIYPNDFTKKLDSFIDNMGNLLHKFDYARALPLDTFNKPTHPLHEYVQQFENHYNIKLSPSNIDVRACLSLIANQKLKVLVISPFKELIDQQIQSGNLSIIQPKLSETEFITYKFPYTFLNDGPHQDSQETLKYIQQDIINNYNNFDIAILSCGCYGSFVLDAICNIMNKEGVYIGGQLPLIFGIIGNRDKWALRELYPKHLDYIINGVPDEYKPKGFEKIEDGCYW
jgi:hypothetical protein